MGWFVRPVLLVGILLLSSFVALHAQSPPAPSCTAEILKLAACLSFVEGQEKTPQPACCNALPGVLSEAPICLCYLIGYGNSSLPVPPNFNVTLAKELPTLCNLKTNPDAVCPALVNGTASSPFPSPTGQGPTSGPGTPGTPPGVPAPVAGGPGLSAAPPRMMFPMIISCLVAVVATAIPLLVFIEI